MAAIVDRPGGAAAFTRRKDVADLPFHPALDFTVNADPLSWPMPSSVAMLHLKLGGQALLQGKLASPGGDNDPEPGRPALNAPEDDLVWSFQGGPWPPDDLPPGDPRLDTPAALRKACFSDDVDEIRRIAALGSVDLDAGDVRGATGLMYAAAYGNVAAVHALLQLRRDDAGFAVDANKTDPCGRTAYYFAASRRQEKVLTLLNRHQPRVDVDARDIWGRGPKRADVEGYFVSPASFDPEVPVKLEVQEIREMPFDDGGAPLSAPTPPLPPQEAPSPPPDDPFETPLSSPPRDPVLIKRESPSPPPAQPDPEPDAEMWERRCRAVPSS
ncbi:hypothetical protein DFJ74DRAFT_682516 [Hyaloraphidium curvatum]|nr:hypothetical protein DFJ74DRAFT_682516 [Hyaloraphidium curvatum]